ncbi:hypothetical protein PsAD13_01951 [Pseudovibrio sp. Ad13]|nr:hypothetical protein PsAD13_01951 [Pseudovibrio sp. Ad13]
MMGSELSTRWEVANTSGFMALCIITWKIAEALDR